LTTQKKYDAIIVGAGLAGIACALRLNKKGLRVLVLEKNDKPGGKLSELHSQGFRWDQGPSLLTEPENINELFELYGRTRVTILNLSSIQNHAVTFLTIIRELR